MAAGVIDLVQDCAIDYEACSQPDPSFVLSRLLQLQFGSDGQISVTLKIGVAIKWPETSGGLEYVAFTYCWGGVQE